MSLGADISLLRPLPLFGGFSEEQLRLIAFSAEPLNLPDGTVLFHQGSPADTAYVVAAGRVKFTRENEDVRFEEVGRGTMIGEMALLCPTERGVTATTVGESRFLVITRRLFRRVLMEYPEMAVSMRETMARRLAEMSADLARARHAILSVDGDETD